MKGIKLLFAVLLAPLVFHAAVADDASDIARAATRRGTSATTVSSNRQKSFSAKTTDQRAISSRTGDGGKSPTNIRDGLQTGRTGASVIPRTTATPDTKAVSGRTTSNVLPRGTTTRPTSASRNVKTTRAATTQITPRLNNTPETRTTRGRSAILSRSASAPTSATTIMSRDFGKCRDVFYSCMDEFCANKDTQLRRCACSSRASEFDATKKNLAQVEEKLLDFSERLLSVNLDAEDVTAMNQATSGELAFNSDDKSASKKMLDEIAKKLNNSFADNKMTQSLNAITLSLDTDAAFDSIDSMMGASTTVKSGTALYSAALPTCREMAAEVCSADELAIAESGYQMTIEQDCNTVAKSYQTQVDMARNKVFESGALLDMSRLDIHQQRNSDDILTCKKKMLDMLTDTSVCGTNLGKCLDISGRYIDPTTGAAFLTSELINLGTLITRPDGNNTWTGTPGNAQFVNFLNSKKIFLEPAMEKCQDISTYVWDAFVEDALAQIKLAQNAKLEDMRQSCTTLTTQCLDNAIDSISEFDARALSIFGVAADTTVQGMCSDVMTACSALMKSMDNITTKDGVSDWESGMTGIATTDTYESILATCRQVGQNCIIQACTSITGNFGLCENIDTSINRKSIVNRTACWNDVKQCVAAAGIDSINRIMAQQDRTPTRTGGHKYSELYDGQYTNIYDICSSCDAKTGDCAICRLAEEIWGNCEHDPKTALKEETDTNKILVMDKADPNETLLSWFARNTGTDQANDSCRDTTCPIGTLSHNSQCISATNFSSDGTYCPPSNDKSQFKVYADDPLTNCCETDTYDWYGNCCANTKFSSETINTGDHYFGTSIVSFDGGEIDGICHYIENPTLTLIASYQDIIDTDITHNIVCTGTVTWTGAEAENYPNGKTIKCDGEIIDIRSDGKYLSPTDPDFVEVYYNTETGTPEKWDGDTDTEYQATHSFINYPKSKTNN